MQNRKRFWIGVASGDHVFNAVQGGFAQLCHGKHAPLRKMSSGDWIIYYSPKVNYNESTPHQKFTAIGKIIDDDVYQVNMGNNFIPFRRNIDFIPCIETPIKPLISKLSFIKSTKYWGYSFRYGHIEISEKDFKLIAEKMVNLKGD
ncbi:EVE domain-containing protein [Neobacillus sp. K501]